MVPRKSVTKKIIVTSPGKISYIIFITAVTKEITFRLSLIYFYFMVVPTYSQVSNCYLKRDRGGIKVFTCKTDTSKFRSLMAEFVLEDTSLEELETFMWDVDNYVNWQYNMVEANLVKKLNDKEMIYRSVVDAPWPVDDRELLVQFSVNRQIANQLSFFIHSVSFDYPIKDGLIRVPFSQASWHVEKLGADLQVKYTLNIDPGGYVPPVLVNMAMADGPYESFHNLKNLIEKK
jgi:hypothetical protein